MKRKTIFLAALAALCVAVIAVCSFPSLFPWDERTNRLLCEALPRLAVGGFLLFLAGREVLLPPKGGFLRALLWSLPCLFVALANFPYSALILGSARIDRPELLPLFLLKCLSVALMEELFFRGLLLPFLRGKFEGVRVRGKKEGFALSVLVTAALFSLMHLFNLFYGATLGATALQLGYTFLLGVMFAVLFERTHNIWLCVFIHALFDVGGIIVTDLGSGGFQDTVFWILTAAAGAVCAVHILISALKMRKREQAEGSSKEEMQ